MNICFTIGALSYSGAEKIMTYLIQAFRDSGENITVLLLSSSKEYDGLDGIRQIPMYDEVMEQNHGRIMRTIIRQKKIREVIRSNDFDVIISFGVIFNIDLLEACRFLNKKIIVCERNDPYNDPHSKLLRLRRTLSYPSGYKFVFQTEEIKHFFSNTIQKRAYVIPNFIEKKVDEDNKYNPQRKAFATCARLDNRQKDQLSLIRAFASFQKLHPDYILEFYGNGPDKELLENEVEKQGIKEFVVFKGRVNNPMKEIKNAEAFVLSSFYEGMPNALIEAMSYGMPCISSDCSGGGAKALIKDGENGLLFDIGDVVTLTSLMSKIVEDKKYAHKLGEEAYKINDELAINRIINLWKEVIYS